MMPRAAIALPNRRPGETRWFVPPGGDATRPLALTIGFDPATGRPAEAFLAGAKAGSDLDERNDNDMIALSKLLQAGADPAELADTFGRQTLMGAVAAVVAAAEASNGKE